MADYWAISKIGIGSTLGLIGLVSLPRGFVFRPPDEDPHPMPWLRVLLSCAIGDRLYPDPQWDAAGRHLAGHVPACRCPSRARERPSPSCRPPCRTSSPCWSSHRPARLRGRPLGEVLHSPYLQREALLRRFSRVGDGPRPDGARAADPGLRRSRPGQGERAADARAREPDAAAADHHVGASPARSRRPAPPRGPMSRCSSVSPRSGRTPQPSPALTHRNLIGETRWIPTTVETGNGVNVNVTAEPLKITVGGTVGLIADILARPAHDPSGTYDVEWYVVGPVPAVQAGHPDLAARHHDRYRRPGRVRRQMCRRSSAPPWTPAR